MASIQETVNEASNELIDLYLKSSKEDLNQLEINQLVNEYKTLSTYLIKLINKRTPSLSINSIAVMLNVEASFVKEVLER